ncbi:MAG: hypothetical protein K0R65_176 [Crocinitomicaceae bacterium]|jgi:hypothetical protein|nr:hypothetical protein [Crocinitomicaceae bacterium]
MKNILTTFFFSSAFTFSFFSQFSVSAGPSLLKPFGIPAAYPGFHISGEFNDDDANTLYARFSFTPYKKGDQDSAVILAYDMNTSPFVAQVGSREKYNYTVLEFGKRYYFGDGYESGFGFYGGSNLNIVFNKVRYELDDYNKSLYYTENDVEQTGSIVGFALGLNGGIKNSFYFGTIYLDAGINYSLLAIKSQNLQTVPTNYSNLFFALNIGIRKDFY